MASQDLEKQACTPIAVAPEGFNPDADIPYGCTTKHIASAMRDYLDFLGFLNNQLHSKGIERLESFLMPANFSSMVGEFMTASIPKYCSTVAKNNYHNGHPDMLPKGRFENDSILHANEGIEVKASRYTKAWQGHNPENVWLLVFVFDCSRPTDEAKNIPPRPFRFIKVVGAQLTQGDWKFSGRSSTSRRTITASVTDTGFQKMEANWIYREPGAPTLP
jgi:hypothetical protein